MVQYYPIPVSFEDILLREKCHDEVDLRVAIHQNIDLILRSQTQTYAYDPSFGSLLHKYYAATPPQGKKEVSWRERMREVIQRNLTDVLKRYERRVRIERVGVELTKATKKGKSVVMGVNVSVDGKLSIGRKEKFHYPDNEVLEEAKGAFPLMIPVGKMD